MTLPRFVLGHNSLIGVDHVSGTANEPEALSDETRDFLDEASGLGLEAIILDNHPVALEAANYLDEKHPQIQVLPMIPYAQALVDEASQEGLNRIIRDVAHTGMTIGLKNIGRSLADFLTLDFVPPAARAGLWHFLRDFPDRSPGVVFLHNAVTDLFMSWGSGHALSAFASACRSRGITPGFVTLNPGEIPRLRKVVGEPSWFMAAVNSKGIQMSPSLDVSLERYSDSSLSVLAMSVLGGGILEPKTEIAHALSLPAVKAVTIGTTNPDHLKQSLQLAREHKPSALIQ